MYIMYLRANENLLEKSFDALSRELIIAKDNFTKLKNK